MLIDCIILPWPVTCPGFLLESLTKGYKVQLPVVRCSEECTNESQCAACKATRGKNDRHDCSPWCLIILLCLRQCDPCKKQAYERPSLSGNMSADAGAARNPSFGPSLPPNSGSCEPQMALEGMARHAGLLPPQPRATADGFSCQPKLAGRQTTPRTQAAVGQAPTQGPHEHVAWAKRRLQVTFQGGNLVENRLPCLLSGNLFLGLACRKSRGTPSKFGF